jgi:hypothetical protein
MMMMMQQQAQQQQQQARQDSLDQQRWMTENQARRDAAMMQAATIIVPVLAPLLFGQREKLGDIVAMMNAGRPEPTSLKDQLETFVLVKKVMGDGEKPEGFDPDNIVGSLMRLAGPAASAVGKALGQRPAPGADQVEPAGDAGGGYIDLPQPDAVQLRAPAPAPGGRVRDPVVALIGPHVLYFYTARLDPGLAAEAVADIMQREGVTDGDLNGLVVAFGTSPDWKADLAAQGVDLRGDPAWADEFRDELVAAWTERDRDSDGVTGGTGGVADAQNDAPASAPGLALDDGEATSA